MTLFLFFIFSLILYFWKSNLYSRFLIFAFWCLSILYLQKPNLQYPFLLEGEITGLTALSSIGLSFFSTRSPLSPPSPFSSLPNSVNLCVPDGREYLGSWLLAGSVSLLYHSPLLSSWPPLSPSSLFSSLYNSMNISEWSRLWSAHKEVITG